ncbi:MAG: hypothetical protein ACFFDT_05470 [Candidatus Hodarchaeota archaeon]
MQSESKMQYQTHCLHQLVRSSLPEEKSEEIYRCLRCGCAFKIQKII